MASAATSTVTLAVVALLIPIAPLVRSVPISTNDVASVSTDNNSKPSFKLPQALDVHVVYVNDGEYRLEVRATPDVTDVTTTVSLNKAVTEVTDGVEVLQLTKEGDGDKWISPLIRVKLSNKDVLHLGVHFVQEGKNEMQSVNYFEKKIFEAKDKLKLIEELKASIIKESGKNIKKRATSDSADDEEAAGMLISMTMADTDENGNMQQLSERWGAHGGNHGRGHNGGGGHHGNDDFVQIPFVPVKIPSPVNNAFGLLDGFFGGAGNRDQSDGRDRQRPGPHHRPNHDWDMDGHHGGRGGDHSWGNNGMNGWGGHGHDNGHNHGNNGRWPDRHRPHHNNCHDRDSSDESSNEDNSNERPYSTTRRPGPNRTGWTKPTTQRTTTYATRRSTTPTRTTTPTTTTEQVYDIDIRFGQGQPQDGAGNVNTNPPSGGKDLPVAV